MINWLFPPNSITLLLIGISAAITAFTLLALSVVWLILALFDLTL